MPELDPVVIQTLFYPTTYFKAPKKEAISELRDCYEKHTHSYISAPDFKKGLEELGYITNEHSVKLRMHKPIRKLYYDGKIGK